MPAARRLKIGLSACFQHADPARPLTDRLQAPETTPFVSENADVVVMRNATGKYLMKSGNGEWIPYSY